MQLGADVEALEGVAEQLRREAERLQAATESVTMSVSSLWWTGPNADDFRRRWTSVHRPAANQAIRALKEMAKSAAKEAKEQRAASEGSRTGGHHDDGPATPGDSDAEAARKRLEELLSWILKILGIPGGVSGNLQHIVKMFEDLLLKDPEAAWKQVKKLEEAAAFLEKYDGVVKALDAFGKVLDVASVGKDFIFDLLQNGNLPLDERILHATAEAGLKFAQSEGLELFGKYVGGALAGAASGGLATFLGAGAGWLAGFVVGQGLEWVDGKVEYTDKLADLMLEDYRLHKKIVGGAIDIAVGAADFVGDVASNAYHGAVEIGNAAVDAVVDVFDDIPMPGNPFD